MVLAAVVEVELTADVVKDSDAQHVGIDHGQRGVVKTGGGVLELQGTVSAARACTWP